MDADVDLIWECTTILDRLAELAAQRPDTPAITLVDDRGADRTHLTYGGLNSGARAVARYLTHQRGLDPQTAVLLVYPPSLDFLTALIACMMAGLVPVPVAPPNPLKPDPSHRQLAAVAEKSGARAILTNGAYLTGIRLGRLRGIVSGRGHRHASNLPWWRTDRVPAADWAPRASVRPADVALLQYTSGSTSSPKGVMITHANIVHQLWSNRRDLGLGRDAVAVTWVPHFHDFGLISSLLSAVFGNGRLYLLSPLAFLKKPSVWFDVMSRVRATHTAAPDFAYRLAVRRSTSAQRAAWDLSALKVVMSAAEPVRCGTQDAFREAFATSGLAAAALCPAYGLAEHTVGVSLWGKGRLFVDRDALERDGRVEPESSSDETIQLVGCGRPSQGVDLRVVDPDTLQELPDGRVGELWVDSPSKAAGYWREPDVSAACFHAPLPNGARDGYLRTGDLGFLWGGEVYITGRMKDLVILNGRNLHPADLEETIAEASPLIRKGRVAVFAVPVSKAAGIEGGEGLAVIMEVSEKRPAPAMLDSLVNRVRDRLLSQHRVPCQVLVVGRAGTIRKTTSGKLRRQAMRQAYLDGELGPEPHRVDMLQGVSLVAPSQQPPIQEQSRETAAPVAMDALLAWLVREVATELGVSENAVPVQASLRELGADSLLVLGLSAAIAERWRVELGPDEVAESVSLEQLARTVQSALPDAMVARVPAPEPNSDPLPLTPTQAWIVDTVGYRLPHHWNLPVMLASDTPLRPEIVAAALEMLAGRHMALRMRLAPGGEDLKSWRQIFDADIRVPVRCVDVGGLDPDALRTAVEADAAAVQTTLNLVTGPVIRAVVYRTADATADLLFLCLHHFLIDGVSLRLLLREFEATYLDLESGRPVEPRARPQSYADWTTGLAGNARSHETRAELGYWREMLDGPVGRLPYDHPDDENLEGVARALWFELAPATGDTLLEAVGGPLGVGLESIMLHALEMTFCQWIGDATAPLIDVQRHGRSMGPERGRAERVIAWTNDVFPFRISPAGPGSGPGLRRTLEIQRRLDRVPRSGHGYGLLRYLGDPADRAALCALPTAPVKLLCHSRLAAAGRTEGGRFRLSDEDPGLSYGADLPARYALLIYASVMGGQLRIDITYGGGRFDEDTVKRFQSNLEDALVALARDYRASPALNQKVFDAEGEDGVASDQRMGHRNPDDRTMPRE